MPPPEAVGDRAADELGQREGDEEGGERELGGR